MMNDLEKMLKRTIEHGPHTIDEKEAATYLEELSSIKFTRDGYATIIGAYLEELHAAFQIIRELYPKKITFEECLAIVKDRTKIISKSR